MAAAIDIVNSALTTVGASNITSLTEDTKTARVAVQRYAFVRDAIFRDHHWNCLITRVTLSPDSAAPAFEFTKQFTQPTDPYCLRIVGLDNPSILFRVEGRKLLCNESTINLTYIARILDVNTYDMLLFETLVSGLAADLAYTLVASSALKDRLTADFEKKMRAARHVDATEDNRINSVSITSSQTLVANDFIASRL